MKTKNALNVSGGHLAGAAIHVGDRVNPSSLAGEHRSVQEARDGSNYPETPQPFLTQAVTPGEGMLTRQRNGGRGKAGMGRRWQGPKGGV